MPLEGQVQRLNMRKTNSKRQGSESPNSKCRVAYIAYLAAHLSITANEWSPFIM